jgi:hypothetical protein
LKEWVDCVQTLGMWHSMQPLVGLTGHRVLAPLTAGLSGAGFDGRPEDEKVVEPAPLVTGSGA